MKSKNKAVQETDRDKIIEDYLSSESDPAFVRRVRIVFQNLNLKGNERILDLGCGRGFYLNILLSIWPNLEVYGIDVNLEYLSVAERFVRNKKVRLLNTSATKLPFKKCFFDRVIAVEVIEHIHDRKKPLEEIFRVLKPKGFAVITVPNKNYPFLWDPINWSLETFFQTHFRSDFWTLAGIWADHCRIYSKEELKEDLINVGFKIEKMWFLTKYCFPFSNLIYYGIGMKLVEHGLFSGFNRFSSNSRPSIVNRILLWPIRAIDKLNRKNRISSKSVNIAVKAQKP